MPKPKPEEHDAKEMFITAIGGALEEYGLTVHVYNAGTISAVMVYTLSDSFCVKLEGDEVIVHHSGIDIRYLTGDDRKNRVRSSLLADPQVFENIADFIKNYDPQEMAAGNVFCPPRTVSQRLDDAHKNRYG